MKIFLLVLLIAAGAYGFVFAASHRKRKAVQHQCQLLPVDVDDPFQKEYFAAHPMQYCAYLKAHHIVSIRDLMMTTDDVNTKKAMMSLTLRVSYAMAPAGLKPRPLYAAPVSMNNHDLCAKSWAAVREAAYQEELMLAQCRATSPDAAVRTAAQAQVEELKKAWEDGSYTTPGQEMFHI